MAIEENKVTLVGVNSASVTFSNEANVEKQYKVNANVNVSNGKNIDSFDGGEVKSLESENQLATFYFNQNGGIAINYNDHPDLEAQIAIITIINSFVTDVKNTLTRKESHQFQSKKGKKNDEPRNVFKEINSLEYPLITRREGTSIRTESKNHAYACRLRQSCKSIR